MIKPAAKVYSRRTPGRFRTVRNVLSALLQAVLFGLPWLTWNGRQAFLIDLPGRKLYVPGMVFFPQETFFLLILLLAGGVLLFASTAVAGRIWCGYACPQTLFSQSFMMVERWIEGDRFRRMKLDRAPWSREKLGRKTFKYAVWLGMGVWLGITMAGYFTPIRQLSLQQWPLVAFFTGVSLVFFGKLRGNFCTTICPYARFQGSMFDPHSLIVSYDDLRGEPRGKLGAAPGDCIDCTLCVQACPMGIDIRHGQQFECITCAACIDACDRVMDQVGKPRGLIGYTALEKGLMRPRVVIYALLLAILGGTFLYLLAHRRLLDFEVVRNSGAVFSLTPDGRISNPFRVYLVNRDEKPARVTITMEGLPDGEVIVPDGATIELAPTSVKTLQVLVVASRPGAFTLQAGGRTRAATLVGPTP